MILNDLQKNLQKEIDIKNIYIKKDVCVFPSLSYLNKKKIYENNNTLDIKK
jgi:hypothetical protein